MKLTYPANITWSDSDGVYEVDFPDLPGCITYGETLEDAQRNATEVLTGYLESVLSREVEFKKSSTGSGGMYEIEPERPVAFE